MKWLKPLFASYVAVLIALFLYSFTQVDLSLTLSKSSVYQSLEKFLQNIGFYQRPLSALIFTFLLLLLFIFYLLFLYFSKKNKLELKHFKILIFLTFIILVFSYNAFSYDLFNYIFDAKIVTIYHQNPYFFKASDFTADPMLNFMRWTHRTYPYGPTWLLLTVPLSFLGLGYFLPTFFLFKLLGGFSYLGICFLIYKISEKIFPENKLSNLAFFAFNPLVLIESLVSAHNDLPMIFLLLLSIFLYINRKFISASVFYIFSIGVKFSTLSLIPLTFYLMYFEKTKKKINWELFFGLAVLLSVATILFASIRTTFQPWYIILPFCLSAFIWQKHYVSVPFILASIFSTVIYFPYVLLTDYAKGYPQIVLYIEIVGFFVVVFSFGFLLVESFLFRKR
jgi:hypothetical protein